MSINTILSGITGIESGNKNTAAEFRTLLTDMTETLSASTEITGATISINGGEIMDKIPTSKDFQLFGNQSSTGIIEYGGISINIDNSKFDLGNVKGWIVDNTMNPITPSINYIDFPSASGITLDYLATNLVTYVGLSGNTLSDIIQSTSPFTHSERRGILVLGVVVHSNKININAINDTPVLGINPTMQLYDLIHGIGFFNVGEGNVFKPNGANLNINKTEGEIFASSSNYVSDNKNPHIKPLTSLTPTTFRYRLQDSTEYSDTLDIDPNNYDNGGVLTAVPQSKFTIQRVTVFTSNLVRIQYGQFIYDSIDDAEAYISTEEYISETNMKENGLLRAFIIVKQNATKLNEPTQAKFIECSHWGEAHDTVVGNVHRTGILNHTSTTLRNGGVISINSGDTTTFDIAAGDGIVTDNTTDPSNPSFTEVNWEAITGITVENIATHTGSNIYIDSLGNVVQHPNTFESNGAEGRENIALGGIGHTDNVNVTSVFNIPTHNLNPVNIFSDLIRAIGPFSISGNRVSAEPNTLKLNKTSGRSYYYGSNYQNDKKNPDLLSLSGLITPSLVFATGENIIGFGPTDVDTQQYDEDGLGVLSTLTNLLGSVPHRIWHEPSSNLLIFQYGQKAYKDLATARDSFISEEYVVPPGLASGAYLIAVLITDKSINTSNLNEAIFIPQGKFAGSGGGGSIDTLQSAYTNSTNPEILTDAVRGSVDLRVGSGADSDDLITFQNISGGTTASITGEGIITGTTIGGNIIMSGGTDLATLLTAGSIITAGNGITDNAGTFDLGGTASENITLEVINTTPVLWLTSATAGYASYFDFKMTKEDVSLDYSNGASSANFNMGGVNHDAIGSITITAGAGSSTPGIRDFQMTSSADWIVKDTMKNKGMEYIADYSSNFTDRSLVDKAYVDDTSGKTGYTVSTLPTGAVGQRAYVTDALAPTYLGTLTSGGTVTCPVFHNGTEWVSH